VRESAGTWDGAQIDKDHRWQTDELFVLLLRVLRPPLEAARSSATHRLKETFYASPRLQT